MSRLLVFLVALSQVHGFATPPRPPTKSVAPSVPSAEFVRDAEKKHGRVALLALPTLGAIYALTGDNPVTYLSKQPAALQAEFFSVATVLESLSLRRFGPKFSLKDGIVPGNFAPLTPPTDKKLDSLEHASGRIAMLATAATMLYWLSSGL